VLNRDDLAAFLRTRRHRLRPGDVRLPDLGRRRTPQFAEMWAAHEVESRRPIIKRVDHPLPGRSNSNARSCISPTPASG
jgi:hypothetical protein